MTANNPYRDSDGKFGEKPVRYMPVEDALERMGNPPPTWTPYKTAHLWPAKSLYENGLALLAHRREQGKSIPVWKQATGKR